MSIRGRAFARREGDAVELRREGDAVEFARSRRPSSRTRDAAPSGNPRRSIARPRAARPRNSGWIRRGAPAVVRFPPDLFPHFFFGFGADPARPLPPLPCLPLPG